MPTAITLNLANNTISVKELMFIKRTTLQKCKINKKIVIIKKDMKITATQLNKSNKLNLIETECLFKDSKAIKIKNYKNDTSH
jgi:hypothetical protein